MTDDREIQRLRYALESIVYLCDIGMRVQPEKAIKLLELFKGRAGDALNPRSDDAILRAWEEAELSEGMAHELLGVDILRAREMLHEWQARQCANNGHEWREVAPNRVICVRCHEKKIWQEAGEHEQG